MDVLQFFDTSLPVVAEQVIEAPKIILEDSVPQRTALRELQLVQQLVEVPTVAFFVEQTVDAPVLVGVVENSKVTEFNSVWRSRSFQDFLSGQSSTATSREGLKGFLPGQDPTACGGQGLQGFPAGQGSAASSSVDRSSVAELHTVEEPFDVFFCTFPRPRKSAKVAAYSSAELGAHSSSSTLSARKMAPAAHLEDSQDRHDIFVVTMAEEEAYYWNGLTRTSH